MIFQTQNTLIRPNWKIVGIGTALITVFGLAMAAGYQLAKPEPHECEPCPVGFASYEDMIFLLKELNECGCKGY